MRWLVQGYKVIVVAAVGLYIGAGVLGVRHTSAERERVEPSVRSSPGGYRSFHFWHTGFAGGK